MIALTSVSDGSLMKLTGDNAERLLFYMIWRDRLWPRWLQELDFEDAKNDTVRQLKGALEIVKGENALLLYDKGTAFEQTTSYVAKKCQQLGIEVVLKREDSPEPEPSEIKLA